MIRAFARRLPHTLVVLLVVTLLTMLLLDLVPGNPALSLVGENATPEQLAAVNEELGFDRPLPQRYGEWISDAIQGDLGQSYRTHRDVTDTIRQRLPVTLQLAVMAELMALFVSIPLAVFMALRAGSFADRTASIATSALIAAPGFLIGVLVIYFLGLRFAIFPVTSWVPFTESLGGNLRHAFLPALTIALTEIAVFTRLLRTDLVATLQEDYILAARSRGLGTRYIMFRHALRPSSFSLLTLAGVSFGRLLGGTVIAEQMFGLPGIGLLAIDSITGRDLVVVQGVVLVVAFAYIVINAVVDVVYTWLDPRLRAAT